jgi:hypothetical protein
MRQLVVQLPELRAVAEGVRRLEDAGGETGL